MMIWKMSFVLCLIMSNLASAGQLSVSMPAMNPFDAVTVEGADESCRLSWKIREDVLGVSGVRVMRVLEGTEMRHGKDPLALVEDVGSKTSWVAENLVNGEQYAFVLEAYGIDNKKLGIAFIYAYPGIVQPNGPGKVQYQYASVGDGVVAIYWAKSVDRDVVGYEIIRERRDDDVATLLASVSKVQEIQDRSTGSAAQSRIRLLHPCFVRDDQVENGHYYRYGLRAVAKDGKKGPLSWTDWVMATIPGKISPGEVVLLVNENSSDSRKVAEHYASLRHIPEDNILSFDIPRQARDFDYQSDLAIPLRSHLLEKNLAGKIKVLVTCYGIPLRSESRSVDSKLSDLFDRLTWGRVMGTVNPYFGRKQHFDGTLSTYLVSRLDGPTPEIAMSLVDKAMAAEKSIRADSGAAYFVRDKIGKQGVEAAKRAGVPVITQGFEYTKHNFISDETLWCFAWGHPYKPIRRTPWPDGSIAAWLKSDSLHRLRSGDNKPEYWCEGLLSEGVTATFGAVVEPYREGFIRGDIFFDRFWTGEFSFAEAIGMSTPTVQWAMSAIGDPLYTLGGSGIGMELGQLHGSTFHDRGLRRKSYEK